ncbi:MAG: patatin-like phospholipase family protein [Lachnospiraceae bacterium]|nr:patatin-like phospholipase family protein [Lachnospiraceae bacterium]
MKRAVALSGGGTKGSYELGVWKALRELNLDYQIVTGTSIGAINGALMVTEDYDKAYQMWNSITMDDMMEDGINLTTTIEGMIEQKEAIRPFLKKYLKNKGADISPFSAFIAKMIQEERVRESKIDYGLVTVQFPSMTPCEMTREEIPQGLLQDYMIASAAIFPLFPMHKIGDITYVDGCYHDNLPISLAIRMGADQIIAVDLHTTPAHLNYEKRPYVTYIKPSRPLGTMLNFDHELLMENADMGYRDAMKVYGEYYGYVYTFYKDGITARRKSVIRFMRWMAYIDWAVVRDTPAKKLNKKGDFNRVHTALAGRSGKTYMSEIQYFLAAAEICGSFFGMDVRPVYRIQDFMKELLKKLKDVDFVDDIDTILKKGNIELAGVLAELKWKNEVRRIVAGIYTALREDRVEVKALAMLQTVFPEELAAACFLHAVSDL